jgi:hypothetical protein
MTSEDILTILGLLAFVILFAFSIKMAYEHLFKNYNFEIQNHFNRNKYDEILVRKPNAKEKGLNPFKKNSFKLRAFSVSPRTIYKYRIVEFIDNNGSKGKQWVEITIRYLRKPKFEFK